jgi:SAM-dependent methyltransferase
MLAYRPDTIGVDVNPRTVEWCQAHGFEARVMQPDSLPFDAAVFQSAIMDNVLEHIEQPQKILSEVRRVLIPSGRFVVGVPGRRGYESDPDHKTFYDEAGLLSTLRHAGFAPSTVFHAPLRSQWLDKMMRQYCIYGVFRAE